MDNCIEITRDSNKRIISSRFSSKKLGKITKRLPNAFDSKNFEHPFIEEDSHYKAKDEEVINPVVSTPNREIKSKKGSQGSIIKEKTEDVVNAYLDQDPNNLNNNKNIIEKDEKKIHLIEDIDDEDKADASNNFGELF